MLNDLSARVEPRGEFGELLELSRRGCEIETARRGESFGIDKRPIVVGRNVPERNLAALRKFERSEPLPLIVLERVAVGTGRDVFRREDVRDRSTACERLERIAHARLVDQLDVRFAGPKEVREREADQTTAPEGGPADAPVFLKRRDKLTAPIAFDLRAARQRQRHETIAIEQLKGRLKERFAADNHDHVAAVTVA